jgi:hypothetical protein
VVAAVAAVQLVGGIVAVQEVVAVAAVEHVLARAVLHIDAVAVADDVVVAVAAGDVVRAVAGVDHVVAALAIDLVFAGGRFAYVVAVELVGLGAADELVVAGAAVGLQLQVALVDDRVVAVVHLDQHPGGRPGGLALDLGLVALDLLAALAGLDGHPVVDGDGAPGAGDDDRVPGLVVGLEGDLCGARGRVAVARGLGRPGDRPGGDGNDEKG